jgi:hypothetical protein
MVHRSMRNDLRVVDELYIKRVLLALQDFLFFSLYLFYWIATQVTTLKLFRLMSCLDFLERNFEPFVLVSDITLLSPISPTPDPARYSQKFTEFVEWWNAAKKMSRLVNDWIVCLYKVYWCIYRLTIHIMFEDECNISRCIYSVKTE